MWYTGFLEFLFVVEYSVYIMQRDKKNKLGYYEEKKTKTKIPKNITKEEKEKKHNVHRQTNFFIDILRVWIK